MAMSIPTLLALTVTSIAPAPTPGSSAKTVTFTGVCGAQYVYRHCRLDEIGDPKVGDVMAVACRTWGPSFLSPGAAAIDNFRVLDCRQAIVHKVLGAWDESDLDRMLDCHHGDERELRGQGLSPVRLLESEYQLVLRSMRDLDEMQAVQD